VIWTITSCFRPVRFRNTGGKAARNGTGRATPRFLDGLVSAVSAVCRSIFTAGSPPAFFVGAARRLFDNRSIELGMKATRIPGATDERRARSRLLFGICIASFVGCIDFTIVNTAIPSIQAALGAGVAPSQWIVTAFLIALCAFMVVAGRLADQYGRRRLMYVGMGVFGLASLGAGAAWNIDALIVFRFVQGMSCAVLYTASAAIVSNAFSEEQRGRAMGILFGANGIGLALGPVLGGILVSAWGWRAVFFVNVPVILLGYVVCLGHVRESRSHDGAPIDWHGLVLLVPGVSALLLTLVKGMDWGWTSTPTLAAAGGAAVLLCRLLQAESRAPFPLIDVRALNNRGFLVAAVSTFSLAFFYCAAFFLMPLYLHLVLHLDALAIGFMLLPTTVTMALASPIVGRIADRTGPLPLVLAGFVLLSLSAALQATVPRETSVIYVISAFAVMGLGWGCVLGPSTVAALASMPEGLGGTVTGASWTIHNLGGAVGLAVATTVYRTVASHSLAGGDAGPLRVGAGLAVSLVADPQSAVQRLLADFPTEARVVDDIVEQFFLHGYHAAMWMLLGVTTMTAVLVAFAVRKPAQRQRGFAATIPQDDA
jgi:EmrB/QacA subfamily drug resistance transporter